MKPPRLLTDLLARLLPETERDALLGDLEEEYRARHARDGERAARRWYRRQALAALRMTISPTSAHDLPPSRLVAFGDLLHEVRYSLRRLRRRPLYAVTVAGTIALGIGATSAVLSVANPILFRQLPYPDPGRIVLVGEAEADGSVSNVGYATFDDLRREMRSLESAAAFGWWSPVLGGQGEPEQLVGQRVTAGFFRVLGVTILHGRDFAPEDDAPGRNTSVILSHGLWQRRFAGDPTVIGKPILLSGREYVVAGVLPAKFESLLNPAAQLWRPLGYELSQSWACRTCRHLRAVGRLRPEVSLTAAQAELDAVAMRIVREYPTQYSSAEMRFVRLHDRLSADVRPALLMMLGAAVFVLAIACANVGNLVLARTAERSGEFAVRRALGAGHWRLVQQLVVETSLLCLAGAGGGLLLARWGVQAIVASSPDWLPRLSAVRLDWRVALVALGAALVAALVVGLAPVIVAQRRLTLPGATRPATAGRRQRQATGALVVAEVALALMLLVGAGLLTRSLNRVLAVDAGFEPTNLLTMNIIASGPRYAPDSSVWQMQERLIETVRAVPGVEAAAYSHQIPLGGNFDRYGVRIEDQPLANPEDAPSADRYAVSDGYLEAMGIGLLRGRRLLASDRGSAAPVVVISETLARLGWQDGDPLGKRIQMGASDSPWRTIVGVVGDVMHVGLDQERAPQFYVPSVQWPWAENAFELVVRTHGPPAAAAPAVRAAVAAVDPGLAIGRVASAQELIIASIADRRLAMRLFEVFGAVALLLAAAGVYGLLSRRVAERRREMGIRTALGATQSRLLALVIRDGGRLTLTGVALGLGGAVAASRAMGHLLFGVQALDPAALAAASVLLGGTALLACAVPAWRATRVSPTEALAAE